MKIVLTFWVTHLLIYSYMQDIVCAPTMWKTKLSVRGAL